MKLRRSFFDSLLAMDALRATTGFHFMIPDLDAFPSGGNVYNRQLIRALSLSGIHVSHSAFREDTYLGSPGTLYIMDSLYFEGIMDPPNQVPPQCIGLVHHLNSLYPLSRDYFDEIERPVLDLFQGFLVTSAFTADYLVAHGYDRAMIHLIEPAPMMHPVPRTARADVHALILGTFTPRKGQLAFLEALKNIHTPPRYTLTLAGSPEADPDYARACADLVNGTKPLDKCVRLLGTQPPETIAGLYAEANLFISAAEMETFGMAIQDAVVSGLAVLVKEGGYAAKHLVRGINGDAFSSTADLANAFDACVSDPQYFTTLQENAAHFRPAYHSWETAAQKFIDAFL